MNPIASRLATLMGSASLLTLLATVGAQAQQTAQVSPDMPPETVLVTGSLIHGGVEVGAPVTNLGMEDFTKSGLVTIGELFRTVPAANVAPGPSAVNSNGHQERETRVNIRGLDATGPRSLLMIDGVRFPPQADGLCALDPSIIPALALDHVDILADGASATYGSDAISGVVNVVLKRRFSGAVSQFHVGQPTDGGGLQIQASQLWGHTWDGGDITLTYQWSQEQEVKGTVHSNFTVNFSPWGLSDPFVPIGASIPGTISTGTPSVTKGVNVGTACTNCWSIPRGTGSNWAAGAGGIGPTTPGSASTLNWATLIANAANQGANNYSDPLAAGWEQAALKTNSGVITVDQRLFPGVEFFASGFYTNRRVTEVAPHFGGGGLSNAIATYTVPTANPYYPAGAPSGLKISYDLANEVPITVPAYEVSWRYQFGLNLDLPYDWIGQVYDSRSFEDVGYQRHFVSSAGVNAALSGTKPANIPYLNVFCDPTQFTCNSPATLAYIGATSTVGAQYRIEEKGARFDGPLFDLPAGKVKAAIGGLYDDDNVIGWSGNNSSVAGNAPVNTVTTYDHEPYHVWAEFTQVDIPVFGDDFNFPLMRKLDLEASFRHDSYGGNINLTGVTNNPKLAFTWVVDDMVGATVRGSWGSSFRFANMGEFSNVLSPTDQAANLPGGGIALSISCASGGAPAAGSAAAALYATGAAYLGCGSSPGGVAYGGGPQAVLRSFTDASSGLTRTREGGVTLAPEKAINYSIGLELKPQFDFLKGLDLQATWYSVKINGVLNGFLSATSSTGLANPADRFHFILPSDLGCPVSANANPTTCVPFEKMAAAALADPNADSNISQLSNVYWLNDSGTANSGFIHVTGIDWNASYDWDMGDLGAWNVGVTGTYYLHRYSQTAAGGAIIDEYHQNLGAIGGVAQNGVATLPRMNYRARLGWDNGTFNATLFYNYSSHYSETRVGTPPNVNNQCVAAGGTVGGGTLPCLINGYTQQEPNWITFDLSLGYETGDRPANDYLKNVTVQFTVVNLLGKHSPFEYGPTSATRNPSGYDRNRPNVGRVVGLTLLKNW